MYIIIGGSGYLGRYCIKNILEYTGDEIFATYTNEKPMLKDKRVTWLKTNVSCEDDLSNLAKYVTKDSKIIYLAAYHHPDMVEKNPKLAWKINIVSLANAINILSNALCFYYASSDTVYGEGDVNSKFTEDAALCPVNLYGRHKALAEAICLSYGGNVVRFPFIFGSSLVEDKPHFYDKIYRDIKCGKVVEMFSDSYRSTLSFNQCASYLITLIERFGSACEKVVNIASDDVLSKYDVAVMLANKYSLNSGLIKPISIGDSKGIFDAKRATTCLLDNTKLKQLLHINDIHFEV